MLKKIFGITFLLFCCLAIWYGFYQKDKLIKNHLIINGEVQNVSYLSKSTDYFVAYFFRIKGKLYTAKSPIPYTKYSDVIFFDSLLKGKTIPVVYQTDNPDNSKMLFTQKDYNKYKVEVPQNIKPIIRSIDSLLIVDE